VRFSNNTEGKRRVFTAVVERCPDTGLYVGYVPGFPGAHLVTHHEELPKRGAHPVARKYAGVLARGLRPRVLRTAGYTPGDRRREPGRGAIFEGVEALAGRAHQT